jgi:Undecaprenyl-phosphate glucose phosphotransferase
MLSRGSILYSSDPLAACSAVNPADAAPSKSKGATRLNSILTIYATFEFLAVACSAYFYSLIYHRIIFQSWHTATGYILAAAAIATLVLLISLGFNSFIGMRRQPRHVFLWRGVGAVLFAFSIFLTILFVAKLAEDYSRGAFISQIIGVGITVTTIRAFFYSWLQSAILSNRIEARRVVLIGDTPQCSKFADRLKTSGIQTIGSFRLPTCRGIKGAITTNPKICEMIAECRFLRADDIIVLANKEDMPVMFGLASSLAELPAGIHIVPVDALEILASSRIIEFGNLQTIQVSWPPLSTFDLCIKRAFDLIFATIGLIVLSPLYLVVSAAIKLDSPGPIFFRQTRHGFNNEEIRVLKFRSMTVMEDGGNFTQAAVNDPRVTLVGRILRRTNIDELPQLINVLRGEMSIVGPRPHATAHNAFFNNMIAPFSRRHNVKPGITGWAQVNGFRGQTDTIEKMQRRIEHDLHYVDNWSFLFDIKIIVITLFSKQAYINAY